MEFRKAIQTDTESILQFWKASGASMGATETPDQIHRAIEHLGVLFLLAEDGGNIIGSIIGTFDGWRGNIYRLVVHPSRRRQGIARILVRRTEEAFTQWGVKLVSAAVENDRPWAAQFWETVGYHRDEHATRYLSSLDSKIA